MLKKDAGVRHERGKDWVGRVRRWSRLAGRIVEIRREERGVESLYFMVQEIHEGTIDDPIPWKYNMTLENGKYYIDKDIKYICVRDSVNPMPYEDLAELVASGYVKVA